MFRKAVAATILGLVLIFNMVTPAWATPKIVELIKPISDIKTLNKNIIISGWAEMDTTLEIKVYSREVENVDGNDVYRWQEFNKSGQNTSIVVGPTGFFATEIELKNGMNKIVIKAVNTEGEEEVIEGIVTLSSKDEVKEAVKNLLNINFLDIIKKILK